MILKGTQRAGASALAAHLLNERDNDHVTLLELRGFLASDLTGALREAYAISRATRCKQYLFSLSLNPPKDGKAVEADFLAAVEQAEDRLGLTGQPRAILLHEKEGRRHAHAVWSRIDPGKLKAINLDFTKNRLVKLSKELYLAHGWDLPDGLKAHGGKSPLNFTLSEWQQAKRLGLDPREVKALFREAWARSDSLRGLKNALEERGYLLARGDRRGVVALDWQGEVFALARWAGVKAKDVKDRIGSPEQLPSVAETRSLLKQRVTTQLRGFIGEVKARQADQAKELEAEKRRLIRQQRAERERLTNGQAERWQRESAARAAKITTGLRGLWDRLTGTAKRIDAQNMAEAQACLTRDREQRDALVLAQMNDRRHLQRSFTAQRQRHAQERKLLARQIGEALRPHRQPQPEHTQSRPRKRRSRGGPSLDL